MQKKKALKKIDSFISPYRVTDGKSFRLSDIDPADTHGLASKEEAKELLSEGIEWLSELQDKLYADDRWGLLLIFQAMDAAGKDGTIKHVMSGVNPQGCQVFSFKQPSAEELDHDYMWRYLRCLPERGRIGIFNRSYYEEVLVVRVHEQLLEKQKIPRELISKKIWQERLEDIASIERYLSRNGIVILKFFLHVSRKEQKKRFMERLDRSDKNWKFSSSDIAEREHWKTYMKAYEHAIRATACDHSPWYVVPADNKWYTRLVVAGAIVDCMSALDLSYPEVTEEMRTSLIKARQILSAD